MANVEANEDRAAIEEVSGAEEEEKTVSCLTTKNLKERCCSWNIYWKALTLFSVVVLYLLFGGFIFFLAERPNEENEIEEAQQMRIEAMNLLVDTFVNLSNGSLSQLQAEELVTNLSGLFADLQEIPAESNPLWHYGNAIFFAMTVVTTIGYGTIAPVTSAGRTLFIFYAMIGIPILLIFLSTLGEILLILLTWTLSPIQKKYDTVHFRIITLVVSLLSGIVIFILFPSLIFWSIESWTYGESVYYSFVTLTTVGFGDFVPGEDTSGGLRAFYRICTGSWIWFGLAFISLLIAEIQKILKHFGRKCRQRNQMFAKKLKERLHNETTPPPQEEEEQL